MDIVGREAWVRQQERAQAMNVARSIPAITASRLLSMASQITAVLQQLDLPDASLEDDCRILEDLVVALSPHEDHHSRDVTVALAVAMLLRAWSAGILEDEADNDGLGLWNTWKLLPGK